MSLPVVFLMGPTAAGKTVLALFLCERLPFEIISVDSGMVYRGMNIGTAKPSRAILEKFPHHLVDICEAHETYSMARFYADACSAINEIHNRQKIPLLVGGTGFYFRALTHGVSTLPDADQMIRQEIVARARRIGWEAMHQRLSDIDPTAARRIHPNDPQRIQRALEVHMISGRSMTAHYQDKTAKPLPFEIFKVMLAPKDRTHLHARIGARFLSMLDDGFIDEVKCFYKDDRFSATLPAMRMVGYRQIWQFLDGQYDYAQMVARATAATRQMAKRQMTWFRRETHAVWFDCESPHGTIYQYLSEKVT